MPQPGCAPTVIVIARGRSPEAIPSAKQEIASLVIRRIGWWFVNPLAMTTFILSSYQVMWISTSWATRPKIT